MALRLRGILGLLTAIACSQTGGNTSDAGAGGAGTDAAGAPSLDSPGAGQPPSKVVFAPDCDPPNEFETSCTFAATCAALRCGDGHSRFDAQGCNRQCQESADCAAGERCRFTGLDLSDDCGPSSVIEQCGTEEDGRCVCTGSADCGSPSICVDEASYPASLDCAVETLLNCAAVADGFRHLDTAAHEPGSEGAEAYAACEASLVARREELDCPE